MQSAEGLDAPVVLILSRDKQVSQLDEVLWSIGIDSIIATSWADARRSLHRVRIGAAIVDGDLSDDDLSCFRAELKGGDLRAVLWLASADPRRDQQWIDPVPAVIWEQASKPLWPEELMYRVRALLAQASMLPAANVAGKDRAGKGSQPGEVVAVFSNKGGVGKSTIATNLAVGLHQLYAEKVLLVDADLYYGDIETLLNFPTQRTISDVCTRQMIDLESLQSVVTSHPSGIAFLPRPYDFARVEVMQTSALVDALGRYTQAYDHVIVNMSIAMDELNLSIFDAVNRLLVVTTPEIPAIANTSRFVDIAGRLQLASKISLILNRAESGIPAEQLEEQLGLKFAARLPSAGRLVAEAANEGRTMFEKDPHRRQDITRQLASVVEHVAGRPRPVASRVRRLTRFLRRAA